MKKPPRRDHFPEPPALTIGDVLNWKAVQAENQRRENAKKRRAELEAMGFKLPPESLR